MSDAISHAKKQQYLWDKAREYTCMYFDLIPLKEGVSKEDIKSWLSKYNRTPTSMKKELEQLDLLWWVPTS